MPAFFGLVGHGLLRTAVFWGFVSVPVFVPHVVDSSLLRELISVTSLAMGSLATSKKHHGAVKWAWRVAASDRSGISVVRIIICGSSDCDP